jgi:hypothetical protein
VIAVATTCFADAGTIKLAEMVKYSDLIVVGKVVNARVNGKRIAELAVSRTLKGDPSLKRIRFYAGPSWACDVSEAVEGETGIFFLQRYLTEYPAEKSLPQTDSDGIRVFFLTHSGRGRLVIHHIDGEDFVYARRKGGDVKFPVNLRFARYPKPEDLDLGLIRATDLVAYVRSRR